MKYYHQILNNLSRTIQSIKFVILHIYNLISDLKTYLFKLFLSPPSSSKKKKTRLEIYRKRDTDENHDTCLTRRKGQGFSPHGFSPVAFSSRGVRRCISGRAAGWQAEELATPLWPFPDACAQVALAIPPCSSFFAPRTPLNPVLLSSSSPSTHTHPPPSSPASSFSSTAFLFLASLLLISSYPGCVHTPRVLPLPSAAVTIPPHQYHQWHLR